MVVRKIDNQVLDIQIADRQEVDSQMVVRKIRITIKVHCSGDYDNRKTDDSKVLPCLHEMQLQEEEEQCMFVW